MSSFLKAYEERTGSSKIVKEQKESEFIGRRDYIDIEKGDCVIYEGNVIGIVNEVIFRGKKNRSALFNYIDAELKNIIGCTKNVRDLKDIFPMVYDEDVEEYVLDIKADAPIFNAPFIEIYGFGGRGDYSYASLIEDCGISFLNVGKASDFCQDISL